MTFNIESHLLTKPEISACRGYGLRYRGEYSNSKILQMNHVGFTVRVLPQHGFISFLPRDKIYDPQMQRINDVPYIFLAHVHAKESKGVERANEFYGVENYINQNMVDAFGTKYVLNPNFTELPDNEQEKRIDMLVDKVKELLKLFRTDDFQKITHNQALAEHLLSDDKFEDGNNNIYEPYFKKELLIFEKIIHDNL